MRKILKIVIPVLVLMLLTGTTVFAMDAIVKATTAVSGSVTITPYSAPAEGSTEGSVISENDGKYASPAYYGITYNDGNIVKDGQYLILMVKASDVSEKGGSYTISESSLIYINQTAATADGSVTFDKVYPMSLTDSYILISGTGLTSPVIVGYVDAQGILGDVDGDDALSAIDALYVLQAAAGKKTFTLEVFALADVDGDEALSAIDALYILQAAAGKGSLE